MEKFTPPQPDDTTWKKGVSFHQNKKEKKPTASGTVTLAVLCGLLLAYAVTVSVMYYRDYTDRYDDGYSSGYEAGIEEEYAIAYREGWGKGHTSGYEEGFNQSQHNTEDKALRTGYHIAKKVYTGEKLDPDEQLIARLHGLGETK